MAGLTGSVGTFGQNRHADVVVIQQLLARQGHSPGAIDGRCGRRTVGAIFAYQHGFMSEPDGRVDVNGPTWQRLDRRSDADQHLAGRSGAGAASAALAARPGQTLVPRSIMATRPQAPPAAPPAAGSDTSYRRKVPAPPPGTVNVGLTCPSSSWMETRLGRPRANFSSDCQDMTNATLSALVERRQIGHNHFRGLRPALDSLEQVMTEIAQRLPDLYPHIGSGGMLCCRNIRGSTTAISNHSWGTAVDVAIDGEIEPMGPSQPYLGLSLIAPIFNRHGWYWGGGYTHRKDCMHFECSESLVQTFLV